MRLKDKAIIVTGSTTGIGEAIARRCVAEGARVLIHGLEADLARGISAELGGRVATHIDDLADCEAPNRIVEAAMKAFGRIDGLVNNAAWLVRSDLGTSDATLFDRAMAINLRAPLLLIRSAHAHLKQSRGAVLNIGSINGYGGEINQLVYSISKAGLLTLSRNLGNALGADGIRVNHLVLGWVLTPNEYKLKISEGLDVNWPEHLPCAFVPMGQMTRPEDIAAASVYWLSDESRLFTGGIIELEQYPMLGRNPPKEKS